MQVVPTSKVGQVVSTHLLCGLRVHLVGATRLAPRSLCVAHYLWSLDAGAIVPVVCVTHHLIYLQNPPFPPSQVPRRLSMQAQT